MRWPRKSVTKAPHSVCGSRKVLEACRPRNDTGGNWQPETSSRTRPRTVPLRCWTIFTAVSRNARTRRLWRFRRRADVPERGLYLWGGVGRGKTMLMDLFHECLPVAGLRMHFHRFMRKVHDDLHAWRGTPDPLHRVADGLAERARVLCFDEFFVADIGDAMILGELLRCLFGRGVTLVATSNVRPDLLYENGLQRRRFLPAIAALEKHTLVHRMDGTVDHRLRTLERAEIYHSPLDDEAEQGLAASFSALAPGQARAAVDLEINGRHIHARCLADDVAWFEFAELCEGPRSAGDYIELARCHNAVLVLERAAIRYEPRGCGTAGSSAWWTSSTTATSS